MTDMTQTAKIMITAVRLTHSFQQADVILVRYAPGGAPSVSGLQHPNSD